MSVQIIKKFWSVIRKDLKIGKLEREFGKLEFKMTNSIFGDSIYFEDKEKLDSIENEIKLLLNS